MDAETTHPSSGTAGMVLTRKPVLGNLVRSGGVGGGALNQSGAQLVAGRYPPPSPPTDGVPCIVDGLGGGGGGGAKSPNLGLKSRNLYEENPKKERGRG